MNRPKILVRTLFVFILLAGLVGGILVSNLASVHAANLTVPPICGLSMAQWTFDPTPSSANAPTASISYVTTSSSLGSGLQGQSFTMTGGVSGSNAWTTTHWSTTNTIDITKFFEFDISASGYTGISLTFSVSRSSTGPTTISVQYSSDGTNYIQLQTNSVTIAPTLTSVTAYFSSA